MLGRRRKGVGDEDWEEEHTERRRMLRLAAWERMREGDTEVGTRYIKDGR